MEYLHGLRSARDKVMQIWKESVREGNEYYPKVTKLTEMIGNAEYGSADYKELVNQRDRLTSEWTLQLGRSSICCVIYDAISDLMSEAQKGASA